MKDNSGTLNRKLMSAKNASRNASLFVRQKIVAEGLDN